MKHLLMDVYQVCANKSPWVKLALQHWGSGGWGGLYTGERPQGHHGPLVYSNVLLILKISLIIFTLLFSKKLHIECLNEFPSQTNC
jgi:hypothetical protein